jgi:hypothetical protein
MEAKIYPKDITVVLTFTMNEPDLQDLLKAIGKSCYKDRKELFKSEVTASFISDIYFAINDQIEKQGIVNGDNQG